MSIKVMSIKPLLLSASCVVALLPGLTFAQGVDVQGAWARATVKGQTATGAFMTLSSREGTRLVAASSAVAGVVEVHEMKMDGGVMKMRAVESGLELPAGKPVELKPGGFHIMLMDLKQTLGRDSQVPITLVFRDAKGVETRKELRVPVASNPPTGASKTSPMTSPMKDGHGMEGHKMEGAKMEGHKH